MIERACDFCFDQFEPDRSTARFCCALCREEYLAGSRRLKKMKVTSFLPKNCGYCDVSFTSDDYRSLFCSTECRVKSHHEYRVKSGRAALSTKKWKTINPEKSKCLARNGSRKRYSELKKNGDYGKWREEMRQYECPTQKAFRQRQRQAQRHIGNLLIERITTNDIK